MNLDDALKSHASWKMKLTAYIGKPGGSLRAEAVRSDCQCDLDRWLNAEGLTFGSHPEFGRLKARHADFHAAAASVVARATAGEALSPGAVLGPNSNYGKASAEIIAAIFALRKIH